MHDGASVWFYLDEKVTEKRITKGGVFLSLDPQIYIGGGDNFVKTRGKMVLPYCIYSTSKSYTSSHEHSSRE